MPRITQTGLLTEAADLRREGGVSLLWEPTVASLVVILATSPVLCIQGEYDEGSLKSALPVLGTAQSAETWAVAAYLVGMTGRVHRHSRTHPPKLSADRGRSARATAHTMRQIRAFGRST
jgi:hypothetical protein